MKLHYITFHRIDGVNLPKADPILESRRSHWTTDPKAPLGYDSGWCDSATESLDDFIHLAQANIASFGILRVLFDDGCLYVNHGLTPQGHARKRVVFEDNKIQTRMTLWDSSVDDREMITLYTTPHHTIAVSVSQTVTENLALEVATAFINSQSLSPHLEWETNKLTTRQWRHYHTRVYRDNESWPQNVMDAQITTEQIRQYVENLNGTNLRGLLIRGLEGDLAVGSAFPDSDDYPTEVQHAMVEFKGDFDPLNLLFQNFLADLSVPDKSSEYVNFTGDWTYIEERHVFSKPYAAQIACHFFDKGYPTNGLIWSGRYQVFDREHRQPVPPTTAKTLTYDEGDHYKRLPNPPINKIWEAIENLDASKHNRIYIQTNRGRIFIHSSLSHPNRVSLTLYEGRPEGIIQQSYLLDSAQYGKEEEVELSLSSSRPQRVKLHETISKEFAIASVREYFENYAIHNQYWKMNWFLKPSGDNT